MEDKIITQEQESLESDDEPASLWTAAVVICLAALLLVAMRYLRA